jgi:hypothetical protein
MVGFPYSGDTADRQNVVAELADADCLYDSILQGAQREVREKFMSDWIIKACSGCLKSEMRRGYCGCIGN